MAKFTASDIYYRRMWKPFKSEKSAQVHAEKQRKKGLKARVSKARDIYLTSRGWKYRVDILGKRKSQKLRM